LIAQKKPTLEAWALQRSTCYFVFVATLAGTTSGKALDRPASVQALGRSHPRLPEPQAWGPWAWGP